MDNTLLPFGTRGLADDAFVRALEGLTLANEAFRHYDHVRLAWILARSDPAAAPGRMAAALLAFAAHHGRADRYHDTITRAWMRLVSAALRDAAPTESFEGFLERNPALGDARLPWNYYSDALLQSAAARAAFVQPDLKPLPGP